ncbi:MAG: D-glycerate dehydrogenase, partial [Bacteroidota bacterium]
MSHLFVTREWPGQAFDRLLEAGHTVTIWPEEEAPPQEVLIEEAARSEALITTVEEPINRAVLEAGAGMLKIIAQAGAGYDNVDIDTARELGIAVTNAPGVLAEATADLAFALALAAGRRIVEADAYVRKGFWAGWHPSGFLGLDFNGATVGIVGMGEIGSAFARRCEGFGMQVLYTTRSPKPDAEARGYTPTDLDTLLSTSDLVSLHCPLTEETQGLLNRRTLALMKSDAVLVNTARGGVIDTAALIEALDAGQFLGVGLDVTDPEPLPAKHPLLTHRRVTVSPHIGSANAPTRAKLADLAVSNALAVLAGAEPLNRVG